MVQGKHHYAFLSHYTKYILLFVGLFITTISFAQVQTQKGVSYRYNGKNPRTPLPSVIIECDVATNSAISDSVTGEFTLTFPKLKMGDRIGLVKVKKREMMVFNQHAVDEWSIRKEPLCLILCDANEFEQQKQNLIAIGRREAQKKYDRQKTELQKQLDASQIDRAKYETELDKAYEELDRLHKHLDEYADLFARIDESEIDSTAQRAMDLFNQGQVDEAVHLFEQGNYLEKLKASNRAIQQADQLIETAEQGKVKAEKDREEQLLSLKTQIAAYKMQNEWDKAGALMKGIADELITFESAFEYADFMYLQNEFYEAELYYQKALDIIRAHQENHPHDYDVQYASILNNLANLYSSTQRHQESEEMYEEALEIRRQLAKDNPKAYELELAKSLNNLAISYGESQRYQESEALFLESLSILNRIAQDKSQTYYMDLIHNLNNLGILYYYTQRYSESETMYIEALSISRHLAQSDPTIYGPELARNLNNLAMLYSNGKRYTESEVAYLEALEIYRDLKQTNPKAYEPKYALTLYDLATVYYNSSKLIEGETMYVEALEYFRRLTQTTPKAYEQYLAMTLNNLGLLYKDSSRFTESEVMYLEAIEVRRRMAKNDPQRYNSSLASTLNNLATLYEKNNRFIESEEMHKEALEIRMKLAQSNPQRYDKEVAHSMLNLACLYFSSKRFDESETLFLDALEKYKSLAQNNPETYNPYVVMALGNASYLYLFMGNFIQAEQFAKEALQLNKSKTSVNTKLAASLLLQGKYADADAIYHQYKDELKDNFLQDLQDFEAAGIIPEERKADVEKIRKLLSE